MLHDPNGYVTAKVLTKEPFHEVGAARENFRGHRDDQFDRNERPQMPPVHGLIAAVVELDRLNDELPDPKQRDGGQRAHKARQDRRQREPRVCLADHPQQWRHGLQRLEALAPRRRNFGPLYGRGSARDAHFFDFVRLLALTATLCAGSTLDSAFFPSVPKKDNPS